MNQLPEVRRWVLEPGNADSYVGLKINFIPHHSPELVFLDEKGEDKHTIDMAPLSFDQLGELMAEHGFRQKEQL